METTGQASDWVAAYYVVAVWVVYYTFNSWNLWWVLLFISSHSQIEYNLDVYGDRFDW